MRDELLTQYVEAGFAHLRQMAKLPQGLMSDFAEVARQLGDEGMLKLTEPLGLEERLKTPFVIREKE